VQRGWQAGRLAHSFRDVDRQDWLEQVRAAAEHPEDAKRFLEHQLTAIDDPTTSVGWSADAPPSPDDALCDDELAWLDLALLRTIPEKNRSLEEADGLLTALAAGPVDATPGEYLPEILRALGETSGFDSPEHKRLVVELLNRHRASIERKLADRESPAAWLWDAGVDLRGTLWAQGYLQGMGLHKEAWAPLVRDQRLADKLVMPLIALLPDPEEDAGGALSIDQRLSLIRALPEIALATKAYWSGFWHPLLEAPMQRGRKIGRNESCPCGSGKKYKRCCGSTA
jgi:uncharacterized protein